MPYTAPTFAQAKADLASRLNDPSMVHWVEDELGRYLTEALRTWNAWTAHWREQDTFDLVMLQDFYDLPTVIPTVREQTITNWDMVTDIQYALLEPAAPPGTWTGTDQYTLAQVSGAIQAARDQFLQQSGAVLTAAETAYGAPAASGRIDLDEAVLTVRRATWRVTATQLRQPLLRTDEWAGTHYRPSWPQSTDPPMAYSVTAVPPLTLQLMPPAQAAGTLGLVSINKGPTIDPTVEAALGVPNDFAWVVKFGALAELLQLDGLALDPERAKYCSARWDEGITLAKQASVVLDARINDVTVRIGSLNDADLYEPLWDLVAGVPTTLLTAGQTLLASNPVAGGGGPYTVTLDVVRNAPVPVDDADVLQVGQDIYDAILDYAQHLALIKEGPGQLATAMALLDRAAGTAGIDLNLQQASQPARRPILAQTTQDERATARDRPVLPVV